MTTDTISFVVYLNLNHHSPWPALLLSGSVNETKKELLLGNWKNILVSVNEPEKNCSCYKISIFTDVNVALTNNSWKNRAIGAKISCCFEDDMSSKRYQYLTGTSFFILIHKGHFSYFLRTPTIFSPQVRTKWHVILKWYILYNM